MKDDQKDEEIGLAQEQVPLHSAERPDTSTPDSAPEKDVKNVGLENLTLGLESIWSCLIPV